MAIALTNAQREIINMFDKEQSEQELKELKEVLSQFLARKLSYGILKESNDKGYSPQQIERWVDEHFRTPYK